VFWVQSDVCLNIGSMGCVVDDVTSGICWVICWGISRRVGWSVGCSIGSGIGRLRYFVFASSFFSHRVEGTLATTSLVRVLRSASGVGTCCGSTISRTSLRSEQLRRGHWLGGVGPLGNLRGDSEQQERLPSWFAVSCKLRARRARSP
jgi:hypothetical protein